MKNLLLKTNTFQKIYIGFGITFMIFVIVDFLNGNYSSMNTNLFMTLLSSMWYGEENTKKHIYKLESEIKELKGEK